MFGILFAAGSLTFSFQKAPEKALEKHLIGRSIHRFGYVCYGLLGL